MHNDSIKPHGLRGGLHSFAPPGLEIRFAGRSRYDGPPRMPNIPNPQSVVDRLLELQRAVRDVIVRSRANSSGLHEVTRSSSADTIYRIDAEVDPIIESFCGEWGKSTPLVLVAEGLEDEHGNEVEHRVFPRG